MSTPSFVDGIGAFADRYQGFLLDQWGVIHDGQQALPAALAALGELKRRNKRLVVLSNSGRRAALNRRRLAEMGFNVAMFDAVVTSGEAAWQALERRNLPGFAELGRRCLLFTIGGDLGVVADLGLELVDTPEQADFLFLTGTEIPPLTLDDYRAILERAAVRDLPMVCSNPDRVAPSGTELVIAPGTIAAMYEAMGGTVRYIGKPHAPIYGACLDALEGLELARDRGRGQFARARHQGCQQCRHRQLLPHRRHPRRRVPAERLTRRRRAATREAERTATRRRPIGSCRACPGSRRQKL